MSDAPVSPSGPAGADRRRPSSTRPSRCRSGAGAAASSAIGVGIAIAALWVYALWGPTKKDPPGLLADKSLAVQAEAICTDAANQLAALPPAYESRGNTARAEVIAEANADLDAMLVRLRQIAPAADAGNDGRMLQEWLGDWQTYVSDRQNYVNALADDPKARLAREREGQVGRSPSPSTSSPSTTTWRTA